MASQLQQSAPQPGPTLLLQQPMGHMAIKQPLPVEPQAISSDLSAFLLANGLEQYGQPLWSAGHDLFDLLKMNKEELFDLGADVLDMNKKDRTAFIAAVLRAQQDILNQPSPGGLLARTLTAVGADGIHNYQGTGLNVLYLPFERSYSKNYGYVTKADKARIDSSVELQRAMIPDEFVDVDCMKEVVLLVVGATGAGKSTQIDGMLNYILGIKASENIRFKCVNEKLTVAADSLEAGKVASQTDTVTVYHIPAIKDGPVKAAVKIIDTPGFGDTRGLEYNHKIVDQLTKVFRDDDCLKEHVPHLTAVCFTTQASAVRLTDETAFVWNSIMALFGNNVSKNVMLLFTFADGQHPQALSAIQASGLPFKQALKFNNSALFAKLDGEGDINKHFWDMGSSSMANFFRDVMISDNVSLHQTRDVLSEREKLENALEKLPTVVQVTLTAATNLRESRKKVEEFEASMRTAKSQAVVPEFGKESGKVVTVTGDWAYEETYYEPKKTPVTAGVKTTTCVGCDSTCHNNCAFEDGEKQNCCAMDSKGNCTACRQACDYSVHLNLPYILTFKERTKTIQFSDLQKKYSSASSELSVCQQVIDGLTQEIDEKQREASRLITRMKRCKERLSEIALKPMAMPSDQYLDTMIDNEQYNKKLGWQGRVDVLKAFKTQADFMRKLDDPEWDPVLDAKHTIRPQTSKSPAAFKPCASYAPPGPAQAVAGGALAVAGGALVGQSFAGGALVGESFAGGALVGQSFAGGALVGQTAGAAGAAVAVGQQWSASAFGMSVTFKRNAKVAEKVAS